MGYRHYFYRISRDELSQLRGLSLDDIKKKLTDPTIEDEDERNDNWYDGTWEMMDKARGKEAFEFGKLYWCDTAERIYAKGNPMFTNPDVQNIWHEEKPFIIEKDGLQEAINCLREKVIAHYTELSQKSDDEILADTRTDIRMRLGMWENEPQDGDVAHDWYFEYSVANLYHLREVMDWEKETLIFMGW